MNQIKYLVYACLMIFTAAILSIFIATLSSNEIIAPLPTTIDVDLPKQDNVMTNSKGGNLFRQNCQSCHALDKNLTGPALRGVHERGPWTNRSNLIKWVKNPAAFIPTTLYTKELQKTYGAIMPSFSQLSEEEINAIFDWVKELPTPRYNTVVVQ